MKFYAKLPGGGELKFEREPMDYRKFATVVRLVAFGLYVALTWVIASTVGFFGMLWFYLLTAVVVGTETYYKLNKENET